MCCLWLRLQFYNRDAHGRLTIGSSESNFLFFLIRFTKMSARNLRIDIIKEKVDVFWKYALAEKEFILFKTFQHD